MPAFVACEIETLVGADVVRELGDTMLAALGLPDAELSIVLTDDDGIRRLNAVHRGEDHPTDVLAFPMDFTDLDPDTAAPGVGEELVGDVVLSVPTALRQARAAGHSLAVELRFLLAHGLLHLVGLDHRDAAETAQMDQATARLVAETQKK